ncbi:MAG: alpha/beta hydrolase family protein [Caulobacteraceae bacterium]
MRAAFAIAPAIVQALPPEGLAKIRVPVAIILGDADPVAPPATNGLAAARAIPGAELKVLPGVGHYDFLADCTPAGVAAVPVCADNVPQEGTHQAAIDMALAFFGSALAAPADEIGRRRGPCQKPPSACMGELEQVGHRGPARPLIRPVARWPPSPQGEGRPVLNAGGPRLSEDV